VPAIHDLWGPYAATLAGVVGLWGVLMARRTTVPRVFYWAVGAAISGLLAEVVLGVALLSSSRTDPGDQHVFYGVLIAVTFVFAYLYRSQFRRSPALYYGLLLLFAMGLAIRGIMTFGLNF
jgi:hypothetical protein